MKPDAQAFSEFANTCQYRLAMETERRPANALCVEIGTGLDRCQLKMPSHWKGDDLVRRWLGSGGEITVFGICARPCAMGYEWCPECGHRKVAHWDQGCVKKVGEGELCNCQHYQPKV